MYSTLSPGSANTQSSTNSCTMCSSHTTRTEQNSKTHPTHCHRHNSNAQPKRKQQITRPRIIKHEIINIDDVKEEPGHDFSNWIKLTKLKLMERESKLMQIRVDVINEVVQEQIAQFKAINERMKIYIDEELYIDFIGADLVSECATQLHTQLITEWAGIVLTHTKHKLDCYRKYFTTSRSWFDQRKKVILAKHLWIPIFDLITRFAKEAAKRYFNERLIELQRKFVKSLKIQILTNIFKQKLKLPSTRPHSLVSCSILKECHIFQHYLQTNFDESISVNLLLQRNPDITAVALMQLVIDELECIQQRSAIEFQSEVYSLYDLLNFTPSYVEPLKSYSTHLESPSTYSCAEPAAAYIASVSPNSSNANQITVDTPPLSDHDTNTTCSATPPSLPHMPVLPLPITFPLSTNDSLPFQSTLPTVSGSECYGNQVNQHELESVLLVHPNPLAAHFEFDANVQNPDFCVLSASSSSGYAPVHCQSYSVSNARFSPYAQKRLFAE